MKMYNHWLGHAWASLRRARAYRRLLAGLSVAIAAMVVVAPAAHADDEWIFASADYGYAGATFDWTGPGRASNIDLIVADWGCDSHPVYAYFRVTRANGGVWTTDTRRYDYSGCDLEDNTTYYNLSISDGYNIAYLQVYICRRNGPCTLGGASGRNPYA